MKVTNLYKKGWLVFSLAIIICLLSILWIVYHNTSQQNKPFLPDTKWVEVERVSYEDIEQTVRLIGTIKAKRTTTLVAKDNGTLDYLAESGERVKKGEVIATLDYVDLEKQYKLSQNAEKLARQQYNRYKLLAKKGVVSKQNAEEKLTLLFEAEKNLNTAKMNVENNRFVAPFDGVVGIYKEREGAQVEPGDSIVTFYNPEELIVEFDIPALLVKKISKGQTVTIQNQRFPLNALQHAIDEESHMAPASVNYACNECVIGSTIAVNLTVEKKNRVLVIPYETVFLREGKYYVYVVEQGFAELRPIKLGIREKQKVEVTEGLKAGEQVVAINQARLYPHVAVQIASKQAATSSKLLTES